MLIYSICVARTIMSKLMMKTYYARDENLACYSSVYQANTENYLRSNQQLNPVAHMRRVSKINYGQLQNLHTVRKTPIQKQQPFTATAKTTSNIPYQCHKSLEIQQRLNSVGRDRLISP